MTMEHVRLTSNAGPFRGRSFAVAAEDVIVAAGGLESTRLLMCSLGRGGRSGGPRCAWRRAWRTVRAGASDRRGLRQLVHVRGNSVTRRRDSWTSKLARRLPRRGLIWQNNATRPTGFAAKESVSWNTSAVFASRKLQ